MSSFWDTQKDFYKSREWKDLQKACFKRDGYRCTYSRSGIRCDETSGLSAHHIIPRSKKGADALFNLTTRCEHHHALAHAHMRQNKSTVVKSVFYNPEIPRSRNREGEKRQTVFKYKPTRPPNSRRWS